ncbi:NAD(P)/FAD-dependent oxidoreductase [Hoeflea sp. YIM 152468]|uniref:NAD(P)/FAD-dependent oxidoreductase n=1 Tax=Hoeflea sp. YIM 152468 TaxID=3031759 RepID=UPI0023DB3154|nr:NAD(P)/FAD-dependent oxidoreductase [Hoeflea sp. YIM 152468]MDF1609440.1 NAD(P)/FAD-dependent oxidoreductase [Hoeflea sp. YIM 152468]
MTGLTRRQLGLFTGASALALTLPTYLRAQGKPRVVVIGGGAGGATAARYIAKDSDGAIDVTLIENSDVYTTCFYSNLYVGGFRTFESITHSYDGLQSNYGITKVTGMAVSVDRDAKTVTMADGASIAYDRLVVAPGIDLIWDSVEGYSEELSEAAPHAWQAGPQTQILKARLDEIENGQQILIVAPPNPYRCPPGPYERASMMAHALKTKGLTDSKVIILDPKDKFSKQGVFQEGWEKHYPGMIEWYGPDVHGGIGAVDVGAGVVETDLDTFKGALLNIIPAQKAGGIAVSAGLTDDSGYCPIDAASMRSTLDDAVFVIGDASIAGDMPKSAFSANSQAKVAAMAIRSDLTGSKLFPARYANTCWSLIDTDDSIKVGAQYEPGEGKIASTHGFVSQMDEADAVRKTNYEESAGWYAGITADMFG